MKLFYYVLPLLLTGGLFTSCSSEDDELLMSPEKDLPGVNVTFGSTPYFPDKDNSTNLSQTSSIKAVNDLLKKVGPEIDNGFASFKITDAQYQEIKTFTDELVAGETSEAKVYGTIFDWVVANVRYEWGDNDPYAVLDRKSVV